MFGLAGGLTFFLVLGIGLLVPPVWQGVRDYRTAKVYVESEATILEYVPIFYKHPFRIGKRREDAAPRPQFEFRFLTAEEEPITTRGFDSYGGREVSKERAEAFEVGEVYPVWYDPKNPKRAVLSRRFNPHYYWMLLLPVCMIGFSGLLLRECLRRGAPPVLKGVERGRHLDWRLPPVASQRAMTGCLGVVMGILALLTGGFFLAARDYEGSSVRHRWISELAGFDVNGWWFVALGALLVTLVFVWAFLANLRWVFVPEPEVEVEHATLRPGQSSRLHVTQPGAVKFSSYVVALVSEVNHTPGKPPTTREVILEESDVSGSGRIGGEVEYDAEFRIPPGGKRTRKAVTGSDSGKAGKGELVAWFLRVERRVKGKRVLVSDFEVEVG